MKKTLCMISLASLVVLAWCASSQNKIENNENLNESWVVLSSTWETQNVVLSNNQESNNVVVDKKSDLKHSKVSKDLSNKNTNILEWNTKLKNIQTEKPNDVDDDLQWWVEYNDNYRENVSIPRQYCEDNHWNFIEIDEWKYVCDFWDKGICTSQDIAQWKCESINYGDWTSITVANPEEECGNDFTPVCWKDWKLYANSCFLLHAWVEQDATLIASWSDCITK